MTDFLSIQNNDLSVQISPVGAALARVFARGHDTSLVLGLESADAYADVPDYMGAIVGPVAGRIAHAKLPFKDTVLSLTPNEGPHLLHSGHDSLSHRRWSVQDQTPDKVTLQCTLPDGACGLPGQRDVRVTYALSGLDLRVEIAAISDADTVFSAVPHPYWCLDDSGSLQDHHIDIFADAEIELGHDLTPSGQLLPISGTHVSRPVLDDPALDACFSTPHKRSDLARVASVTSSRSGLGLEVLSNQPGLVVYSGQFLTPRAAPQNCPEIKPFSGLALEPGGWPDAPNHPKFPQIFLPKGEYRRQQTVYRLKMPQIHL